MNFKKAEIILLLIFFLLPVGKIIAQTTNAGFIPGNIWYSKDPFQEGDKIKIYTLIFNPDTRKFSGTVDFFDNNILLGTKDFSVSGTSTKDISINWTVTAGDHQIFGEIKNAKFLTSTGKYEDVSLADNKTSTSSRTVSAKVVAENIASGINSIDETFNTAVDSIQNIGNTAKDTMPATVSQSVTATSNTLDGLREKVSITLQNTQIKTQSQIDTLDKTKSSSKNSTETNYIQKPFEYVRLFLLFILSSIFKYKILFYGILIILIFSFIRYLWQLFF